MPVQWLIHAMSIRDIVSMTANALVISDVEKRIVLYIWDMTLTPTVAMIIVVNGSI